MKKIIVIAALTLMVPAAAMSQVIGIRDDSAPKINVVGEAVVKVTPDKVDIVLGIETWDEDIQKAKKQNNEILRKSIDSIKKTGIKEKDVKTDHLSIEPRYKSDYRKEDFIGYFVRNSISVSITDIEMVEKLLTEVLSAGVTHIHGISFSTSEFKKHREEARRLALLAAREKALKMSAALGKTIGDPIQITEQQQYSPWYYYGGWWGYARGQAMSQNVIQNAGGQSADISDTIALGKISIKGSVSVSFELK